MNFTKKLTMIAAAALVFASCKNTAKTETAEGAVASAGKEVAANLETTTFKIDGMTCPQGCAKTIESKLAGMEGVSKATVDFESKTATVSFDPAKQTAEKFVEKVEKIADGAYKVSDVKSSGDKAYFDASAFNKDKDKDKKKKAKKAKAETKTTKADKKEACAKDGKKAGCCSAAGATEKKASCHAPASM